MLLAGLIFCLPLAEAAERISPMMAQRLIVVMWTLARELERAADLLASRHEIPGGHTTIYPIEQKSGPHPRFLSIDLSQTRLTSYSL
jgi:hypothetical protein